MTLLSIIDFDTTEYIFIGNIIHFVFCIVMLLHMRLSLENSVQSLSRRKLNSFINYVMICIGADLLSYIVEARVFPGANLLNHASMILAVASTAFLGYCWNKLFDVFFHIKRESSWFNFLYLIPTIVIGVFLVINLFTGIIWTYDENNVYSRGPYYFVSAICQYISFLFVLLRAIFLKKEYRTTIRREKLRASVIWLGLLSLLFGLFQIFTAGKLALHCLGITAGVFILFVRFQDDQITNDALTGLSNRYALDTFILDKMPDYADGQHGGRRLYIVMMDIDRFKRINDLYGHIEGDRALKCVAGNLKKIGALHRGHLFLARYGGDEFAAVFEAESDNMVRKLCQDIKASVKEETESWRYLITVSAGFTVYTGRGMTLERLYSIADAALYSDKSRLSGDFPK